MKKYSKSVITMTKALIASQNKQDERENLNSNASRPNVDKKTRTLNSLYGRKHPQKEI